MFCCREAYGLKEAGLLTLNYPRAERPGRLPDDHLVPVGLPNMWTTFKVGKPMVKSSIKCEGGSGGGPTVRAAGGRAGPAGGALHQDLPAAAWLLGGRGGQYRRYSGQ